MWRAPEAAEIILANSGAVVRIGGDRAFYSPTTDHIQMPPQVAFATAPAYCGVLIHEMSHWSGAPSRLNRDLRNSFGSHDYAREELRAEIGQVMVCAELGIADVDFSNNAAYVASRRNRCGPPLNQPLPINPFSRRSPRPPQRGRARAAATHGGFHADR